MTLSKAALGAAAAEILQAGAMSISRSRLFLSRIYAELDFRREPLNWIGARTSSVSRGDLWPRGAACRFSTNTLPIDTENTLLRLSFFYQQWYHGFRKRKVGLIP